MAQTPFDIGKIACNENDPLSMRRAIQAIGRYLASIQETGNANISDLDSQLAGKEDISNKSTDASLGTSDTLYPSQKAVKGYVDAHGSGDVSGPASSTDGNIVQFSGATGKVIKDGGLSSASFDAAGAASSAVSTHESTYAHGNIPSSDEKAGLAGTSGTPSSSNKYVTDNDSRNSDARTPLDHDHSSNKLAQANTHESPDTDSSASSLHHTLGSGSTQAAVGNHTHSGVYEPADANIQSHISSTTTAHGGIVPNTRTVNSKVLSSDITLAASDVGAVATSGNETVAGIKTFSSFPVTPSSAPSTDYQVANKKYVDDSLINALDYSINNGRLTLVSANPFSPTDTTAASTLYFTPYSGSRIAYYDGSSWSLRTFGEISIDISAFTANTNYDIFIYDNSGTFALYAVAWASATSRATALYVQDGVHVLTGATNYNYLGTIRTTGTTGQCEVSFGRTAASGGSYPRCLLWNYRNRIAATFSCFDSTDSWTYTTNTWRQKNNSASNKFDFVNGIGRESALVEAIAISSNSTSGVQRQSGIGYDQTNNTNTSSAKGITNETTSYASISSMYKGMPSAGYHYFAEVEKSVASGTTTWYGDGGESVPWSGMTISWWF